MNISSLAVGAQERAEPTYLDRVLCEYCGDHPPELDDRWCSRNCRFLGERELRQSPTPEEIKAMCEEIRAGWSPQEARRRQMTAPGIRLEDSAPYEFTIPQFFELNDEFDVML